MIQNHWKKLALFWTFQIQFNCRTYLIRQLLSLKLSMDSQCLQATSSKNISAPNVRTEFPIYTARQTVLWQKCQNDVLCGNVNKDVSPYIFFTQFSMTWSYLQRITPRYRQVYKNIYINTLKKLMVTRGTALQITQTQANLRENIR